MSAFAKTIVRSIRGSLGRFLAIFGIVALGCGFYAGLQMCGPDMRAAADAYYDGTNLYDIRLVSTMGFTGADVTRAEAVPGVDAAMAAISCDVMARLGTEQLAVRMSSIDVDAADAGEERGANVILSEDGSYLNRVFLREGRWPQAPNECVISADKAVAGMGVGDAIEVLYGTTDLDDLLHERSFEVVGTVSASTYPYTGSFGSTTLGSGMIGEYVYVARAAFVDDAPFTEMYLRVLGAEAYESGSDAYQETVAAVRRRLVGRAGRLAEARLSDLRADAQAQIDEGRAELEEKRAEAETRLAAGKGELDAAKKELEDGRTQLEEGEADYERGRIRGEAQLDAAQATIDANRAELERGRAELAAGERELVAGEETLLAALSSQGMYATSLAAARTQLELALAELELASTAVDSLAQARARVSSLESGAARYEALMGALTSTAGSLESLEANLDTLRARLDEARVRAQALEDAALAAGSGPLERIAANEAQRVVVSLEEQVALVERSIDQARSYQDLLSQAKADLTGAHEEVARLEEQVASLPSAAELALRRRQVQEGLAGVERLEAAQVEVERGRTKLENGEAQITQAQATLDAQKVSAASELEDARRKLDEARRKIADGQEQYDEGLATYERGRAEADEQLADAEQELADAQAKLDELDPPDIYVLDRTQSEGALTYDADSRRIDSIADVFPLIFFLVAALVSLTTMTRMVDDDRVEIGTYKALGYSTARIASKYLAYAGAASAGGAVLGILVLSQALPFVVTSSYAIIYAVPLHPFPLPVLPGIALASGGMGVGITLLATWAAVVASLREVPAQLMQPKAPAAGKRILLERVGFVWRHLSFSWKVTSRNLFRYKRRLAMTVIGISGCTALLLVGFGLHDAIWDIIDGQYGPIIHFDTTVGLVDDATELDATGVAEFLEETGEVHDLIRVRQENMQAGVAAGGETIRVQVIIPRTSAEIEQAITFRERVSGAAIGFDDEAVVITEKLGLKYGLAPGSEIVLFDQDAIGNVVGDGHRLRVTGVAENYVGNSVYVGRTAWKTVSDAKPVFSTIFASTTPDEAVRSRIADELHERDDVSTVIFSDETIGIYRNMLSVVDLVVVVLIVSAGLLAFIVLYNLTNINIGERVREIASLKVLGFTRGEVYAYIFREIALLSLLGDALGMVLGRFLASFVITTAEVDYVMFGRTIHPTSYAYSFALTLVFTGLILLAMRRKLDRVNMVESLKSVE